MTYEELKKAYDEMSEKCSDLEKKIESKNLEIEKNRIEIENNKLEIENLTEQLLKRNRMLFGKKAERSKYLNVDGQLAFDESFLVNEAEEQSDENADELMNPMPKLLPKHPRKNISTEGELCIKAFRER